MNTAIENVPNTAGRAAWVCLAIAWVCFLLPVPGLGLFIGWPLNLVAFILAVVAMSKRGAMGGVIQLLASLVVSPIVYLIGWGIFAGAAQVAADRAPKTAQNVDPAINQSAPQGETQTESQAPAPLETVTAKTLFSVYDANEIVGDNRFKGKRIVVTGIVGSIDSGMDDEPTVSLEAGEYDSVQLRGIDKSHAAGLNKGQQISAECVGGGEVIGTPMMDDCKLI